MGRTRTKRHDRYQVLFHADLDADGLSHIRAACQTGTPLGNDAFKAKIERKLHCQVGQARPAGIDLLDSQRRVSGHVRSHQPIYPWYSKSDSQRIGDDAVSLFPGYRVAGVHYACDNGVCDRNAEAARECHQRKSRLGRETIWRATR